MNNTMRLRFKVWLYADRSKISWYSTALAVRLREELNVSHWAIEEVPDSGLARPGSEIGFFPLQVGPPLLLLVIQFPACPVEYQSGRCT